MLTHQNQTTLPPNTYRSGAGVYNPNSYGTFVPPNYNPNNYYPNNVPDGYSSNANNTEYMAQPPIYTGIPLRQRVVDSLNAFTIGLVADPLTMLAQKTKEAISYPFQGKKEALISAGVVAGSVIGATALGGVGFIAAPLGLAGVYLGGKEIYRFLKSQFSDTNTPEQKDDSWRLLAHAVGTAALLMSMGTAIKNHVIAIQGKPFIDVWKTLPNSTKGWEVLHNLPQLTWVSIQSTLSGLTGRENNYSNFGTKLWEGTKHNAGAIAALPKKLWDAVQR
jgi:hypothetical protein